MELRDQLDMLSRDDAINGWTWIFLMDFSKGENDGTWSNYLTYFLGDPAMLDPRGYLPN